ncbi:MAG: branched-chain amino acid ABC transporter permease [Deltaproteobacteria bacterium]|jgi:branched-chain amino acid transport system permease protein|nr:branched-chain amino acid ABC transporter permease [Deltaproteobacteria bacterium]
MELLKNKDVLSPFSRQLHKICMTPLGLAGLVFLLVVPLIPGVNAEYIMRWLTLAAYFAACTIIFDFTAGFINIVNFGFMAFCGVGAYCSSLLVIKFGFSPWLGMIAGGLLSGLVGLFTGVITLRLRGIFAACLTWFVGLALMGLCTKLIFLTRGQSGLSVPKLFESSSNIPYYYTIVVGILICFMICSFLVRSKMGLAFKAIGQNMEAAQTSGVNPVYYRVVNFVISCTLAGVLGGFYAHYIGILTPDILHTSRTMEVLAISYIGGRGSLWGGVFAAMPLMIGMELVRSSSSDLPGIHLMIYGVLLIIVMIYFPGGIAAEYYSLIEKLKNIKLVQWATSCRVND